MENVPRYVFALVRFPQFAQVTGSVACRQGDLLTTFCFLVALCKQTIGKYHLKTKGGCSKLTIFSTQDVLYSFTAGWLYNEAVPVPDRQQLDRDLLHLRIGDTIRTKVEGEVGGVDCSPQKTDINAIIVLVPIAIFVAPPLLLLLYFLFKMPQVPVSRRVGRRPVSE